MLWIISGPTSAGKTRFLNSPRCAELTGLPPGTAILSPKHVERSAGDVPDDAFCHYNILRSLRPAGGSPARSGGGRYSLLNRAVGRARRSLGLKKRPAAQQVDTDPAPIYFDRDPAWERLVRMQGDKKAIVLVAHKRTLVRRAAAREFIGEGKGRNRYPAERFLSQYADTDLVAVYQAWCRVLEQHHIPYILVDAEDDNYPVLGEGFAFDSPDYALESTYTRRQVIDLLASERFAYHRVNLPYGLHTGGDNRGATFRLIFPSSLEGRSVLDVGCGIGYYCFEAERRGAAHVVGTELKPERFKQANLLKDINQSQVEFILGDVLEKPPAEQFDDVLLLNVIHHLADPVRMIRTLAACVRERLIIEFSTFTDPTIKRSVSVPLPGLVNRFPLIGVGSMAVPDPTFVFTPSALTRILTVHDPLFARVEMIPSPLPGRVIAICHKADSSAG